ncbi:MAG: SpoIIE family protein phosphatase [Cyanobacteria bacterium]|nr:SpoIIE family protein phosphatase [Cyanobacteriota bacterium]
MFRILIVDDDPAIRLLLQRTLKKQGYDAIVAEDGMQGLQKAETENPALIICDWMMPHLDGIEVCRNVKANAGLSTTFFILLTSLGSVEDRVRGLDAGADDFLSKPIEMNELKARVRAGLRLHQLSRDLQHQKRLLEDELAEAADYVQSLLPSPIAAPVDISARFIPSRQLGGDCFDFYWLDDDRLVVYLVDAAGHGLKAALPSLSVLNLLRSQALPNLDYGRPSAVLSALNSAFQISDRNDKYFTAWYGVYHRPSRTLTYASGGHPPAILVSSTTAPQPLRTPGLPVGMFPEADYQDATVTIDPSSSLYIFSDGIYEINLKDGSLYGLDPFIELLDQAHKGGSGTVEAVVEKVSDLNPLSYFEDDLSLLRLVF